MGWLHSESDFCGAEFYGAEFYRAFVAQNLFSLNSSYLKSEAGSVATCKTPNLQMVALPPIYLDREDSTKESVGELTLEPLTN